MKPERVEYEKFAFLEENVQPDPHKQFALWWDDAVLAKLDMVDAAHLSTVDEHNRPDARVILIKYFDTQGLVFFTNYESAKGKELAHNNHACISILWPALERQIRIRGHMSKTNRSESEVYFKSRPHDAQIGAWASPQSRIISRTDLDMAVLNFKKKYPHEVPCPPHWGGFRLTPWYFEFWQGRKNRLHDRIVFTQQGKDSWSMSRLAP